MIHVLMVDDEPLVRRGIVAGVDWAALGCEVVGEAQSGEEGLELARRLKPELIITDIRMPKMDGITMMNLLREEGCAAHCIVLTAHSDFEICARRAALRRGRLSAQAVPRSGADACRRAGLPQDAARIRRARAEGEGAGSHRLCASGDGLHRGALTPTRIFPSR